MGTWGTTYRAVAESGQSLSDTNMNALRKNFVLVFVLVSIFGTSSAFALPEMEDTVEGGFGDKIKWWTLDEGLLECKNTTKPMMMVIHKSWCKACDTLKTFFKTSSMIQELSQYFVMINLKDPEAEKQYMYYYFTANSVEISMAKAIRVFYDIVEEKPSELYPPPVRSATPGAAATVAFNFYPIFYILYV